MRRAGALIALMGMGTGFAAMAAYGLAGASARANPPADDESIAITVTVPERSGQPAGSTEISDAVLTWGVNLESTGGAYFGGCNFLMAGRPGENGNGGSSHVWGDAESGLYHASAGQVEVVRPMPDGGFARVTWAERCLGPDGEPVRTGGSGTGTLLRLTGGTGTLDRSSGTATVSWKGTFSVVFYGGMTYWWATDPVLRVTPSGAVIEATAGGYGADRNDPGVWRALPSTPVTLLAFNPVAVNGRAGFTAVPRYLGETVAPPAGSAAQERTGATWGSFPQNLITFLDGPGQASYWYSSGHQDYRKPPYPVAVAWTAADPVVPPSTSATTPAGGGAAAVPVNAPLAPYAGSPSIPPEASAGPTPSRTPSASSSASASGSPSSSPSATPLTSPSVVPPRIGAPGAQPSPSAISPGPGDSQALAAARYVDLGDIATYGKAGPGLVPEAPGIAARRTWVGAGLTAVLALTAMAIAGFRSGWLVWPSRRRRGDHAGPAPRPPRVPTSGSVHAAHQRPPRKGKQ